MLRDVLDELATVIREELADVLDDDDLNVQVERGPLFAPSVPIVVDVFDGLDSSRESVSAGFGDISGFYVLTVRARCSLADAQASIDLLTDMVDDQHELCIAGIVESDQTLNGWATQVVVDADGFSPIQEFGTGEAMFGRTWRVLVGQAVS